jgi:AcrR family transcriptional regulator
MASLDASSGSLRERKKARLRVELMRAAVDLFKEQGFAATTVEEIAARAETSPSTFFRYFGTKEDVLFGDTPERLETLRHELVAARGTSRPLEALESALIDQIVNFTNFDDGQLEADCAELWFSEPGPRRRYVEIVLEWEHAISEFLAAEWELEFENVKVRVTALAVIAAVRVSLERGAGGVDAARAALLEGFALLDAGLGAATDR